MANIIYEFDAPTPLNLETLDIEIAASTLENYVTPPKPLDSGKIGVTFSVALTEAEVTELTNIVQSHTGQESRTTLSLQQKRELVLSKVVNMAHVHPLLKAADVVNNPPHTGPDVITGYLTSIDNWFNAWKRDGNHAVLAAKITADANDITNNYHGFLNTEVNPNTGVLTYQFLIGSIPVQPYI